MAGCVTGCRRGLGAERAGDGVSGLAGVASGTRGSSEPPLVGLLLIFLTRFGGADPGLGLSTAPSGAPASDNVNTPDDIDTG